MAVISTIGNIFRVLNQTPVGFFVKNGRVGKSEEVSSWRAEKKRNPASNVSLLKSIGIITLLTGAIGWLIGRVKDSKIWKIPSYVLAFCGLGAIGAGFVAPSTPDIKKAATGTSLMVRPEEQKPETNQEKSKGFSLARTFNYYKEKIISSIRSRKFDFLDDQEIVSMIGGILGTPGIAIVELLKFLRGEIPKDEQQVNLPPSFQNREKLKSYYKTLGFPYDKKPEDITFEDIKKAYRAKAKLHHPDKNPGDTEAPKLFNALQEAYDVLSNAEKRKQYDTLLGN